MNVPNGPWEALSRGVSLPARRRRLSTGGIIALGLAALFVVAMGGVLYSLAGGHRGGGPVAAVLRPSPRATPSPSAAAPSPSTAESPATSPCAAEACPTAGPSPRVTAASQPTCDPRSASAVACGYASPTATSGPTSPRPASPGATANPSGVPACAAADITVQARTDRSSYPAGQAVTITGAITNHGGAPCTVYTDYSTYSCNPVASVLDSNGQVVWQSGPPRGSGMPCRMGNALVLQPGQVETHDWTWNQTGGCPGSNGPCSSNGQEPAGSYSATVRWSGGSGRSAAFSIT